MKYNGACSPYFIELKIQVFKTIVIRKSFTDSLCTSGRQIISLKIQTL